MRFVSRQEGGRLVDRRLDILRPDNDSRDSIPRDHLQLVLRLQQHGNKVNNANVQVATPSSPSQARRSAPSRRRPLQLTTSATACSTTSTFPTNRAKVFYAADMWWDFFTCNGAFQYSTSFDGVTWAGETSIPALLTAGYTAGPYFDVEIQNRRLLRGRQVRRRRLPARDRDLAPGGTNSAPAGTISWTDAPCERRDDGQRLWPDQHGDRRRGEPVGRRRPGHVHHSRQLRDRVL